MRVKLALRRSSPRRVSWPPKLIQWMPGVAANAVRLQLHAIAYNLGNFMRTLM